MIYKGNTSFQEALLMVSLRPLNSNNNNKNNNNNNNNNNNDNNGTNNPSKTGFRRRTWQVRRGESTTTQI